MASQTIRSKYPAQIAVMTTAENKERFQREAEAEGISAAEVIRRYLDAGIDERDRVGLSTPEPAADDNSERAEQYRGLL